MRRVIGATLVVLAVALAGCDLRTGELGDPCLPDMKGADLAGPCIVGWPEPEGFTCAGKACGGIEIGRVAPVEEECGHPGQPCCFFPSIDGGYCFDNYAYRCVTNHINGNSTCARCN